MESRSHVSKTEPIQDWQGYLDKFKQEASTQGFAAYLEELKAHGRAKEMPIPVAQFAPLQVIVLIQSLSRAALLACIQLPQAEVQDALARVVSAADTAHYGRSLQGDPTAEEIQVYQRIRIFIPAQLRACGPVLKAIFRCYANGDYGVTDDADELMREARSLAEKGDSAAALSLVGRAGAVALRTKIIWQGWNAEGDQQFRNWANVLHTVLDHLQNVAPLGDVEAERQRAKRVVSAFAAPKTDQPTKPRQPWNPMEPEEALELVTLAKREQPFTDDEIRQMGVAYDRRVEMATTMLDGRHRTDLEDEGEDNANFEDTKHMAVSLTIRTLGLLRPQSLHVVRQLIHVIGEAFADEDMFEEPPTLKSAVVALGQIGQPAIQPCIEFLRYSSQHHARFHVADALGVAGRGDEEAFQTLFKLAQQTELEQGKIVMACALAKLHDDRAIPLVADLLQALSGPDVIQLSDLYEDDFVLEDDQFELMDALHELNAIEALDPEPNSERYYDDENDESGAVIVRGYGRIARAVPANWDYPDRRADDDEDEENEETYDEADDYKNALNELINSLDKPDSQFTYSPKPKLQPIVNTNKVGRNEPCPCGSGKKYKHCHGKDA